MIAVIGALGALSFPSFYGYYVKSQITSGYTTLTSLSRNSEIYWQENLAFPLNLDHIGAQNDPSYLGVIALLPTENTLQYQFNQNSRLSGAKITYIRHTETGWRCHFSAPSSVTLSVTDIPKQCKWVK